MKIAFPTQENNKMDSPVYGHFGSAPYFIIVDSETSAFETVNNADAEHLHGQCQPLKALAGKPVDAVVVGGIGAGALHKLNEAGINVFRAIEGAVSENLELIKSGMLPPFTADQTCIGHSIDGACAH
ncbi:NifB/NifX family molybdenum-iron cluster-binding protein [Thermodesulfobacteriota bacterium]